MYIIFKRFIDFFCALGLLLILTPLMILLSVLLTASLKGNPFFLQLRPGYKAKPFTLIKFRTMSNDTDSEGILLPDERRVTKLGGWVRSSSLDEIPQLLNVLKGDMSFIGPRPLLIEYLGVYSEEEKRRHNVKPGISGWAQINGRNSISWKEKFKMDLEYVDNYSLLFDIKIVLLTIKKVLIREGVNASGSVTMEKYNGSN